MSRNYNAITILEGSSKPVPYAPSRSALENSPPRAAMGYNYRSAHAFAQMFGLLPGLAFPALAVDLMRFRANNSIVSTAVGVALGIITLHVQRKWYGDDYEPAFVKALIVWAMTAFPLPLSALLYIPAGIIGFRHKVGMTHQGGVNVWLKAILTGYGNQLRRGLRISAKR